MRQLKDFAMDVPLHCSGLLTLVQCPWRVVMMYLFDSEDGGGVAGDTGSAMHKAAAAMHRGKDTAACLEEMAGKVHEYPLADLQDAAAMFLSYAADDRNRAAKVLLVEEPIAFQIAAAEDDPTGAPIQVVGTLDQVRVSLDGDKLWDIKTTKKDPLTMMHQYRLQLAAYCVGATVKLGRPVHPGGCIYPRRYRNGSPSTSPVFYHAVWTLEDTDRILEPLRRVVRDIRRGIVYHVAGEACDWCHARSPDVCLPKLKSLNLIS